MTTTSKERQIQKVIHSINIIINKPKNLALLILVMFVLVSPFLTAEASYESKAYYESLNDCTEIKCNAYFASQDNDINICLDNYSDHDDIRWCVVYYAVWEKDSNVCNSMDEYSGSSITDYKGVCFYQVALATRDTKICNYAGTESVDYCKSSINKLQSSHYNIYFPILLGLFFATLILFFLFLFKKNTKTKLIITSFIPITSILLMSWIINMQDFIENSDFFFQYTKIGGIYFNFINSINPALTQTITLYGIMLLSLIYLPTISLIKAYKSYKVNDPAWWKFLLVFFTVHILGNIAVFLMTAGYGLIFSLPVSGIVSIVSLIIFFRKNRL